MGFFETGTVRDAGVAYCRELHENTWYGFTEAEQAELKEKWTAEAKARGLTVVSIRLVPDPLFPMHGAEKPYIAWQERLNSPPPVASLHGQFLASTVSSRYGTAQRETVGDVFRWLLARGIK